MMKFLRRTVVLLLVILAVSMGLAKLREGRFSVLVGDTMTVIGMLSVTWGFIALFTRGRPTHLRCAEQNDFEPGYSWALISAGILSVGAGIWLFQHPLWPNSYSLEIDPLHSNRFQRDEERKLLGGGVFGFAEGTGRLRASVAVEFLAGGDGETALAHGR